MLFVTNFLYFRIFTEHFFTILMSFSTCFPPSLQLQTLEHGIPESDVVLLDVEDAGGDAKPHPAAGKKLLF